MKKIVTLLLIGLSTISFGQTQNEFNFDITDFNEKMKVAEWLCTYDKIAWWTSDSVIMQDKNEIARLGKEWFCFEVDSIWHAVYGKYENNQFDLVFHFIVNNNNQISKSSEPIDTNILHRFSRALQTADNQIASLKDTLNIRFNQYIKENEDKTLTVWIFPAFQPNNYAVYGGEFVYVIDQSGSVILKDESYYQGQFRGFKVDEPREIWLNYKETEKPTLGAVFFAWYYKSYFTKIMIENSKSKSFPFGTDYGWTWIHVSNE